MRRWRLTGLEFVALWEDMRESGVLPSPFGFTCRIPLYRDYLEAKKAAGVAVRRRLGDGFEDVLDVVAKPDIRIVTKGVDLTEEGAQIRLQAARRGSDAYLLEQLWGEPGEHGGEFIVEQHPVLELGTAVAARIPDAAAGELGSVDLISHTATELDQEYGRSLTREPAEDPGWHRAERFLRSSVTGIGIISVEQGISRFGPQYAAKRALQWRDLDDDGRYVITDRDDPMAFGVDANGLTARIDALIADVVRAIKDGRR
ncbi:ESX secretion-associated protein EspG [Nocardia pneumoniae]|uniref:ESX secretion-associated protein EspG n=1 Tax=Nocardia pneumoniae TaxID=228601 RepID=UPI001FDF245C|nr:ESX secretion-associated protein EspG [Nocardia pneumoniae]